MKKLLTFAVLAAVAASCTQSEVEDVKQSNEYIGIASATVNNMVLTRAGEGSPLNQGSLGLFVTTEGDDIFKVDNMRWNYGESGWTSYGNLAYEGNGKQTAYAYHPYRPDVTSTSFEYTILHDKYDWGIDLLWWKSDGPLNSNILNIGFSHAISKFTVNLKKNEEVLNEELGDVTVGGIKTTGTVNLIERTWNTDETEVDDNFPLCNDTPTEGFDGTATNYLIPQTVSSLTVSAKVGSKTYTWTSETEQVFEPGHAYTLNLTIGSEVTAIGEVTVSAWQVDEAESGIADHVSDYLTGEGLRTYMAEQLAANNTDITVNLKPNASYADFHIIREELKLAEIEDGSINLTITGAVSVPGRVFANEFTQDNNEETVSELQSITLPDAIVIGEGAFISCSELIKVYAPKVKNIENDAFNPCSNLKEVYFPQVQSVGFYAFGYCKSLISIDLPELLTVYEAGLGCMGIKTINLPKVELPNYLGRFFEGCDLLTDVVLPATKALPWATFRACVELISVDAPNVSSVGPYAFTGCDKIQTLKLTTEEDITIDENAWNRETEEEVLVSVNEQIDLVLNKNKEPEVTNGNVWKGFTFKSITFEE